MSQDASLFPDTEAAASWRAALRKVLKGGGEDPPMARSRDGIPVGPLYPMGHGRPVWRGGGGACRIVQRIDHPDSTRANALALADVEGGASGLTLVLADAPAAHGFGLRISGAADLAAVFDGIRLDTITLRIEADTALPAAAMAFADLAERQKLDTSALDVDFGLDPIGLMAHRGGTPEPWPDLGRKLAAALRAIRGRGFVSPVLRADGRPHHAAGASEAQELAAMLATGVAYLRALETDGQDLEGACAALNFTLAADADVFLSLAKIRALRRLWARVEAGCGSAPRPIRIHAETAWRMLTRRDAATNMLRGALGCSAALMGGADSVTVLPHTAALGPPDAAARRIARNMPLVLLQESGLARVADPAAGAGAFEALTRALCGEAWRLFQAVEREGGLAACLRSGSWQGRIEAVRERRAADLASGASAIVGTTAFRDADERPPSALPVEPHPGEADLSGAGAIRFPALVPRRDADPFEAETPP